jgi:hypothetical protein
MVRHYKKLFGYTIRFNDITTAFEQMEPVVGSVQTMRMAMPLLRLYDRLA